MPTETHADLRNHCTEQKEQKEAYFPLKTQQTYLGREVLTAVDTRVLSSVDITSCMMVPCISSSNALKLDATYSRKTSVEFHWTTWRYNPEDRILHNICNPTIRSMEVRKLCVRST
jgi:hypothetical protein